MRRGLLAALSALAVLTPLTSASAAPGKGGQGLEMYTATVDRAEAARLAREGFCCDSGPTEKGGSGRPPQLLISASTSSRLRSISSRERASRLRRSSGSVFDGRTLKCQSSAVTEIPSRCEISPSAA